MSLGSTRTVVLALLPGTLLRLEVGLVIEGQQRYYIAVVGAGPAGLFAARELAERGFYPILFNRDIKPGGLAEYGIYPTKQRMKEGLRGQFRQIMSIPSIEYYGNVVIGENADLALDDLRCLGFQAILVTVGAQSTKRLGIPGEDLCGVYHAKDIVYHYNLLPPFSEHTYQIGKRVAVVGVGNVMMDIARWLLDEKQVDQVTAVARRGPAEVKFDRKELESVVHYLDNASLEAELTRVSPAMQEIGQNPDTFRAFIESVRKKGQPVRGPGSFHLHFLATPTGIEGNSRGCADRLTLESNRLVLGEDGESRARGTGRVHSLEADTVIFAIGDLVDSALELPVQYGEFAKSPRPRFPVDGISYEAYDPETDQLIEDTFLAGWARRASAGLVGVARKDGINAAQAVAQYLETLSPADKQVADQVRQRMMMMDHPIVDKPALLRLEALERERALEMGVESFKFSTNQQMLEVLELV